MSRIRFITDSTCDLPQALIDQHAIRVIPCYLVINDESIADDNTVITREAFYRDLPTMPTHPSTAAMPPSDVTPAIEAALSEGDHVVLVSVANKLSGVHNAMRLAAAPFPADRVTVIDSESLSMGLGYQVLIGAETAAQTGDVAATLDAIRRVRQHSIIYLALATLEFLRRSGRISWAAAGVGSLLQIKPILEVHDSEIFSVGRVRTVTRAKEEIIEKMRRHFTPLDRLTILYGNDEAFAHQVLDEIRDIAPSDTLITSITPTIGTHTGPSGVGLVPLRAAWRNA